jgi:hypothetical protein
MWVYEYILVSMSYGSAGKGTKKCRISIYYSLQKEERE